MKITYRSFDLEHQATSFHDLQDSRLPPTCKAMAMAMMLNVDAMLDVDVMLMRRASCVVDFGGIWVSYLRYYTT